MQIALVNSTDSVGGAAIACNRLLRALNKNDINAKLLVQEKKTKDDQVVSIGDSSVKKIRNFYNFAYERFVFTMQERSKEVRFAFSLANIGNDVSHFPLIQDADIIHLHWFNNGYLSIDNLKKLCKLNKPIVWTLHDMWAFTGGCHYPSACQKFTETCHHCDFLKHPSAKDLSSRVFSKKFALLNSRTNITYVSCSNWLKNEAERSSILRGKPVVSIPNAIDTNVFVPRYKPDSRKKLGLPTNKRLVLFGAGNIWDKRKGIEYLIEALKLLQTQHPNTQHDIELVVFGKSKSSMPEELIYPIHNLSMIHSEEKLVDLYNAADVFVLPSLQDNLPNTIMESLACGTPVVAFDTGGIPEMIDHQQNGYVATYKSHTDLAKGIHEVIYHPQDGQIAANARKKVVDNYSEAKVAQQYLELYKSLLK